MMLSKSPALSLHFHPKGHSIFMQRIRGDSPFQYFNKAAEKDIKVVATSKHG